jgi:hypothetical protein
VNSKSFEVLNEVEGQKKKAEILAKKQKEKEEQEERQKHFNEMVAAQMEYEKKRRETARKKKEEKENEILNKSRDEREAGKIVSSAVRKKVINNPLSYLLIPHPILKTFLRFRIINQRIPKNIRNLWTAKIFNYVWSN